MNNSEPENNNSNTEIEIVDLDTLSEGGKTPRKHSLFHPSFSFRTSVWKMLGGIVGTALLVMLVLASIPHPLKKGGEVVPTPLPLSAYSTVVLSVTDGVAYAASGDGVVSAIQVSNGSLLWRNKQKEAVQESAVMDGVMYIASVTTNGGASVLSLNALHTSNGSLLWSNTFSVSAPTLFPLTVIDQEIFVRTEIDSLAFRTFDGSLLWHNSVLNSIAQTGLIVASVVFNGVDYVCTMNGSIHALRANNGSTLWQYKAKHSFGSSPPIIVNGTIYLILEDGSIDAVRSSNGSVVWHRSAQFLFVGATALGTDNTLYVNTLDGSMFALRANDGLTLWHTSSHIPSVSPIIAMIDGVVYIGTQSGNIYALHASNGVLLWQHTEQNVTLMTTIVTKSMVYLVSLLKDTDSITTLGASNGATLWHFFVVSHISSSSLGAIGFPIVINDILLLALQDGSLRALCTSNGSLLWQYATE